MCTESSHSTFVHLHPSPLPLVPLHLLRHQQPKRLLAIYCSWVYLYLIVLSLASGLDVWVYERVWWVLRLGWRLVALIWRLGMGLGDYILSSVYPFPCVARFGLLGQIHSVCQLDTWNEPITETHAFSPIHIYRPQVHYGGNILHKLTHISIGALVLIYQPFAYSRAELTRVIAEYTIYYSVVPFLLGCGENRLNSLHLKMKGGGMFGRHLLRCTWGYHQLGCGG